MTNGRQASPPGGFTRRPFRPTGFSSNRDAGAAVAAAVIGLVVIVGVVGLCVALGRRKNRSHHQAQTGFADTSNEVTPYATFADQGFGGNSGFDDPGISFLPNGSGDSLNPAPDAPLPFDSAAQPPANNDKLQSPYDF